MDRLTSKFIDANPNVLFTSNFPLHPFTNQATDIAYDDPRRYIYTTIGDMAKDTKALSYIYAPPACPDVSTPKSKGRIVKSRGGNPITLLNGASTEPHSAGTSKPVPIVLFEDVSCTATSFQIDVFTSTAISLEPDPVTNTSYIGRVTRLGMGPLGKKNSNRCNKPMVTRTLDASKFAESLEQDDGLRYVITDLSNGKKLAEEATSKLGRGFEARVVWIR
jgi:hypothetical protein